jgi:DNA-binding NtrC family response regulator
MEASTTPYALVVDDEAIVRMEACYILEDAGFRVVEAASGMQGRDVLEQHGASITLMMTDVQMPGEWDGFALARYAAERWPELEIVVASGQVKPAPGDLPGRATFIGKPFSQEVVHAHLREMLPDGKKPEPLKNAC